jgi:uncharacterized protein (DUF433 family)
MSSAAHEPGSRFDMGIYSLQEASRLVGMSPRRVRRLVKGYEFRGRNGQLRRSPPLIKRQLEDLEGAINLSFLDLIEMLFVRDFRKHGVTMPVIRRAAEVATEMYEGTDHPFCLKKFSTDGRHIFATAASQEGDEHMIDLVQRQQVFAQVMEPFLKQLEYSEAGELLRWFPLGKNRPVMLDPSLSFGKPIVRGYGVPTAVLYAAHEAGETPRSIADWYDLPGPDVEAAIEFERSILDVTVFSC